MKPRLKVYVYSTNCETKSADLILAVTGGEIRFDCTVDLNSADDIIPETLRFNSMTQSEFLYDGSVPKNNVFCVNALSNNMDNIYPVNYLRTDLFNPAIVEAMMAIANQAYDVEYC
ncbi:hypothetical protein PL75_10035 [Neisseria arctica]|uniref:Uncharacterized protein n=1 Tax=Neisseria arctica TaxID=1470200 RepID=A0A0J0YPK9_9NEIS|nr:hypothetical protein [Neisseria arctica]KLT72075.1 hypothetical protein PL75_10035 [Neisseria arctica]UOO85681.1 hypothetical protein LVJ86_05415 [Neisseria arctica]